MSNKITNTFENSLVRVDNKSKQPKNSLSYSLNSVINDVIKDPSTRTNEKGFDSYISLKSDPYNILGSLWLGKEEYVFFIKNKEGNTIFNEIWYVDKSNSVQTLVYSNIALNFQDNYEIKATYRVNYKGERIIYWVDGNNPDRLINIDINNSVLPVSLLSSEPDLVKGILKAEVSSTTGSMTSGQYIFGISYNIGDDFTSGVFSLTTPISIAKESYYKDQPINETNTLDYSYVDGEELNVPTNKAVNLVVSNLDPNYTGYNIVVIKVANDGSITTKVIRDISINTNTYLYTGGEGEIDPTIILDDVIVDTIKYYASEAIIQKENRLLRGNTKIKNEFINYQLYANNIKVNYVINDENVSQQKIVNHISEPEVNDGQQGNIPYYYDVKGDNLSGTNEYPRKVSITPEYLVNTGTDDPNNKTFMRDEIYSLGIGFELEDGTETDVFHIPGRAINTFTNNSVGTGEYNRTFNSGSATSWDSSTIDGQPYWKSRNTAVKRNDNTGELAYWRSNQVYPDGYGFPNDGEKDINNRSYIRHHKMPSDVLLPIYSTTVTGDPNIQNPNSGQTASYLMNKVNIGLTFSNIEIPTELRSRVKKINFFYTPRTEANKSIISKGIMYSLYTASGSDKEASQQVNSSANTDTNYQDFEFISPEINFKFKNIPLNISKINVNGVDKGTVIYRGAITRYNPDGDGPPPSEDKWLYNLKQYNTRMKESTGRDVGFITAQVYYNQRAIPKEKYYSKGVTSGIYVDANFNGTTEGTTLNYSGNQNSSYIRLDSPLRFRESSDPAIQDYYPTLNYPAGAGISSNLIGGLENTGPSGKYIRREGNYWDTVYYVSLKKNDSNLYGNIKDLTFTKISSGSISYNGSIPTVSKTVWGGDTFIDNHHYKKTYTKVTDGAERFASNPFDRARGDDGGDVSPGFNNYRIYEVGATTFGSFMVETDLNIRMRREGSTEEERYWPKSYLSAYSFEDYMKALYNTEYYKIEDAYNINYIRPYYIAFNTLSDIQNNISDRRYSTRIVYSEVQNLESRTDNYRLVKANNYRDLPLNRGFLSTFFIKEDKLFATTRDSLFMVYTSNQTIKSESGDNITVGTGEFLGIEPTELISIDGGFGGTSSKFSLAETPFGYLFVDRFKNKVLLFGDGFKEINMLGLNEDFTLSLYKQAPELANLNEFDNPANNIGISSIYDPRLQRIIVTKKDYTFVDLSKYKGLYNSATSYQTGDIYVKDGILKTAGSEFPLDFNNQDIFINKSFTVSYNPISSTWISYHSYLPKFYIPHPTDYLKFDTDIEKSNSDNYSEDMPFVLEFVFNDGPMTTKVFDSIVTNVESYYQDTRYNKFFDEVLIYNDQQCSGVIQLVPTQNVTKKEKEWNINKFLDITTHTSNKQLFTTNWDDIKQSYPIDKVINPTSIDPTKPWYQRGRFRDKYLAVRFTFKNLENIKLIVNFVSSIVRLSQR